MRKLREKLKEAKPNEYKIHLEKERQRDRKRRENMKRKETTSTRFMAARRLKETERKRKYRQKKKENSKTAYADAMELEPLLGSYSCVQSLGKAVEAACSSVENVKIIHLLPEEVEINKEMLDERWRFVIGIDKLQSLSFLKGYNKESLIVGRTFRSELSKFRVFKLDFSAIYPESDSGSAACETSPLDSSKGMVPIKAPTVADITAGSFLLVEFTTSKSKKTDISIKYRYAGIAQTSMEDDGEDSNLDLPIISILVYCKTSALDHATTEVGLGDPNLWVATPSNPQRGQESMVGGSRLRPEALHLVPVKGSMNEVPL
uniref:Uncharacterized protein n=1 Tax=Timema genevievae TaxID=629358 RepID=A0A7R9JRF6_TIMGE|nr:unnamed protein product [Timema genevievae]